MSDTPDITTPEGRKRLRDDLEDAHASARARRPAMLRERQEILDRKLSGDETFGDPARLAEVRGDLDMVEQAERERNLVVPLLDHIDKLEAEISDCWSAVTAHGMAGTGTLSQCLWGMVRRADELEVEIERLRTVGAIVNTEET